MSEHSDDAFDRWLADDQMNFELLKACERAGNGCDWERDDDGLLECKNCGKVVDL